MLKFWLKFLEFYYSLLAGGSIVDTFPVVRYWSEVLCLTILTHLSDFEVKVMDFYSFSCKTQLRQAMLSCDSSYNCQDLFVHFHLSV